LGLFVFIIISTILGIPGIRLLMLWLRTRLAPEGLLSLFFLGFAVGLPIRLYYVTHKEITGDLRELLSAVSIAALLTGVVSLAQFTRKVFRPDSGRASLFFGLTVLVACSCVTAMAVHGRISDVLHPAAIVVNLWTIPIFWWAFVECAGQYRMMSRQAAIGIGEPLVRNRFLLWSLWTGAIAALPTAGMATKIFVLATTPAGAPPVAPPALLDMIQLLAVAAAAISFFSIWLSFFPPKSYSDRIAGHAAAPGDA